MTDNAICSGNTVYGKLISLPSISNTRTPLFYDDRFVAPVLSSQPTIWLHDDRHRLPKQTRLIEDTHVRFWKAYFL